MPSRRSMVRPMMCTAIARWSMTWTNRCPSVPVGFGGSEFLAAVASASVETISASSELASSRRVIPGARASTRASSVPWPCWAATTTLACATKEWLTSST